MSIRITLAISIIGMSLVGVSSSPSQAAETTIEQMLVVQEKMADLAGLLG